MDFINFINYILLITQINNYYLCIAVVHPNEITFDMMMKKKRNDSPKESITMTNKNLRHNNRHKNPVQVPTRQQHPEN